MASRAAAQQDPQTTFPTNSPALYRAAFGKGQTNGKAKSMISDTRLFPSTKRKGHVTEQNMEMTSPGGHLTGCISIEETLDPGFTITNNFGMGNMCACVRSTTRLQDPDAWINLAEVQELTIEDEQDVVKIIPQELYSLLSLRMLTIRWSGLNFVSPELGAMQLTQLHLSNNKLQTIDSIANMKSLTVLNLAANCIQTLPKNIGNLSFLRELNVSGNQLSDLPVSISELAMLNELVLTSNSLTNLQPCIGSLLELRLFDVSLNRLSSLPDEIGLLEKLTTFVLSYNRLSSIPDTFSGLTQLKWLFIRKNKFSEVPKVLLALPSLEVLNMNENNISIIPAPSSHLKHLMLDKNDLKSLPDNILACKNLESLSLERNSIRSLPGEISQLSGLRVLHLGGNDFEELPPDVGKLQELRHLMLNDSGIEHLPSHMESLRRLSVLNLDNTHINGAWMSAYRQGIPAVLDYARTIKDRAATKKNGTSNTPNGSPGQAKKQDRLESGAKNEANSGAKSEANSGVSLSPNGTPTRTMSKHGKAVEEIGVSSESATIFNKSPKGSPALIRASSNGPSNLMREKLNGSPALLS